MTRSEFVVLSLVVGSVALVAVLTAPALVAIREIGGWLCVVLFAAVSIAAVRIAATAPIGRSEKDLRDVWLVIGFLPAVGAAIVGATFLLAITSPFVLIVASSLIVSFAISAAVLIRRHHLTPPA